MEIVWVKENRATLRPSCVWKSFLVSFFVENIDTCGFYTPNMYIQWMYEPFSSWKRNKIFAHRIQNGFVLENLKKSTKWLIPPPPSLPQVHLHCMKLWNLRNSGVPCVSIYKCFIILRGSSFFFRKCEFPLSLSLFLSLSLTSFVLYERKIHLCKRFSFPSITKCSSN